MGFSFAPRLEGSGGRGGQTSLVRSGSTICWPGGPGHDPGQPQACLCSSVTRGWGDDSHLAGGSVVITWYTGVLAEHQLFSLGWERPGGQDRKRDQIPRHPTCHPTPQVTPNPSEPVLGMCRSAPQNLPPLSAPSLHPVAPVTWWVVGEPSPLSHTQDRAWNWPEVAWGPL